MTDKYEAQRRGGQKGGKATGPQKSWILKLSPEERSKKMRELVMKRYEKRKQANE